MQEVTLENTPQQEFSVSLGGSQWLISLRTAHNTSGNCTLATLQKDGVEVVTSVLCAPNAPLMPYGYMSAGNFVFVCDNGEYPYYENFGITTKLYWLEADEINEIAAQGDN
jgi:hypothetical protein